jgi:hypothetical protein
VANTPQAKKKMKKDRSRRSRAAFAKECVVVLVELGLHNPIAALILDYAMLVDQRIEAAKVGEVGVLRIGFAKTLQALRGLWCFFEVFVFSA